MLRKTKKLIQSVFRKLFLVLILIVFFVVGCQTTPVVTPTNVSITKTSTSTPIPTPTLIYQEESISFEDPGEWRFSYPYVFEDWNKWIIPDGENYKLDENYEIESVELSYQWWGLGDPVFEYQQIRKTGGIYKLNGKVVIEEKILNLVKAINNLHPVPQTLNSITHTDDYPIWAIEITGIDNTKILLTSNSNTPFVKYPFYIPKINRQNQAF